MTARLHWHAEAALPAPAELAAAIEECLLRAPHLESQLDKDHPAAAAGIPEAIAHYGSPNDAFQRWAAWAGIEQLRSVWRPMRPVPAAPRASTAFRTVLEREERH